MSSGTLAVAEVVAEAPSVAEGSHVLDGESEADVTMDSNAISRFRVIDTCSIRGTK